MFAASVKFMKPAEWVSSFLGVLGFVVAVWTLAAGRSQEVRAGRPYVRIDELFARSSPRIGLTITNVGPGVLIPDSFALIYKGQDPGRRPDDRYADQWDRFRDRRGLGDWADVGAFEPGVVQPPGGNDILIILREFKDGKEVRTTEPTAWMEHREQLMHALSGLTISLRYHSVFKEQFEIRKEYRGRPVLYKPTLFTRLWLARDDWSEWSP